jgi:catalase
LNRNPDNFFAETEQVAFHPGHVVPGIDFSNDPLLQGRLFSYLDTQLTRLGGPNFAELPINRPTAPVHNNQRDGFMRHTVNTGHTSYQPNSVGGGCPFQAGAAHGGYVSFNERIDAQKVRERSDSFHDHFSQATLFWKSQSPAEQDHIVSAFRFELGKVMDKDIRQHVVDVFTNVDVDLAARIAAGIGVLAPSGKNAVAAANKRLAEGWDRYGVTSRPGEPKPLPVDQAPELSMANTIKDSIKTRRIAILAADGFDAKQVDAMKAALTAEGAVADLISALPAIKGSDGKEWPVDKTINTVGSVLYDAVYVPGGQASATVLAEQGDVIHFVNEAFKHCKAIAATGEGVDVLLATNIIRANGGAKDAEAALAAVPGLVANRARPDAATKPFIAAIAQHRAFDRQGLDRIPA